MRAKAFSVLLIWLAAWSLAVAADKSAIDKVSAEKRLRRVLEGPHVTRGNMPVVKLQRSITASAEEAAQIKKHIANLAKIDRPDFGLSGTMDGMSFAPLPGTGRAVGGFLLTNHQLNTSDDFRQLVALGPRALPFLLEALDDKTPTKLTQIRGGIITGMYLSAEMGSNPTNSVEQQATSALPKRDPFAGRDIADYRVKVGDVCFAIIGQIVGRRYQAVRYQPTAIVVINSPAEEKALAKALRDIWSSTNAAQRILDSLLFDYTTEGAFNGESLGGWDIASDLQTAAAMRMLYYFPQETAGIIAQRLAHLDVRAAGEGVTNHIRREVANGARTEDFIKAVAWSEDPGIKRELLEIFKRTTDPRLLLAALPGIEAPQNDLAFSRLNEMIDQLPEGESGPYGQGYDLLVALGAKFGQQAKPTFLRYLHNATLQRWRSMAQVLRKTRSEWAVELLAPALTDRREFGWTYALVPGQNEPRRPIRVCDEAAETISLSRRDLPFKMAGEHGDLDRQIATIRARIQGAQR